MYVMYVKLVVAPHVKNKQQLKLYTKPYFKIKPKIK